jgi:hypothetical protein
VRAVCEAGPTGTGWRASSPGVTWSAWCGTHPETDGDGGRRREIREFRTTTGGLITLADWLRSRAVTVVGMESTGVYWRAIYYLLEDEFECQPFNALHLRHVPRRKRDVQDAEVGLPADRARPGPHKLRAAAAVAGAA